MKITVVGNAPVIQKVGNLIDDSDIIMRFNNFEIIGNEEKIGTRTTHLVWQPGPKIAEYMQRLRDARFDISELWSIYIHCGHDIFKKWGNDFEGIPLDIMGPSRCSWHFHNQFLELIDKKIRPTSGLVGIAYFKSTWPKETVQIVGFGPRHKSYRGQMFRKDNDWYQERAPKIKEGMGHDLVAERDVINEWENKGFIQRIENGVEDES